MRWRGVIAQHLDGKKEMRKSGWANLRRQVPQLRLDLLVRYTTRLADRETVQF